MVGKLIASVIGGFLFIWLFNDVLKSIIELLNDIKNKENK